MPHPRIPYQRLYIPYQRLYITKPCYQPATPGHAAHRLMPHTRIRTNIFI